MDLCAPFGLPIGDAKAPVKKAKLTDEQKYNEFKKSVAAEATPFGLSVTAGEDVKFINLSHVVIRTNEKILPALATLASLSGLVLRNDEFGSLRFSTSIQDGTEPVGYLVEGNSPCLVVSTKFNGQEYYSTVSAMSSGDTGYAGAAFPVSNPFAVGNVRPIAYVVDTESPADTKAAANSKFGRMFANAIQYVVKVSTWRSSNGNLWDVNTLVQLNAPGAMVYSPYNFVVRNVTFSLTEQERTAELTLVLPGAFEGKAPERLPWVL
jgi:prophage tail gpP-like protein